MGPTNLGESVFIGSVRAVHALGILVNVDPQRCPAYVDMTANKATNVAVQKTWVLGHDGEIKATMAVSLELSYRLGNLLASSLGAPNALNFINDNVSPFGCPFMPFQRVWR